MNVLLTGAAGLIGMAVWPMLKSRGHHVVAIDITDFGRKIDDLLLLSLDEREPIDELVVDRGIDAIVHCGAISGPMMFQGEPLRVVAGNIDATALLLDVARVYRMKRFVFCSSISVYGDAGKANITEATPFAPTSVYGATKVACEQLIRGFAKEYGVPGVSLRISRVYGPYRRANCHLNSIIRNSEQGIATDVPCEPDFIYHYVYVDDVAEALCLALEAAQLPSLAYNIGSGEAMAMRSIVDAVIAANPHMQANLVEGKDDVPDEQTAFDVSLAERELRWKPKYSIGSGVAAYRAAILAGRCA